MRTHTCDSEHEQEISDLFCGDLVISWCSFKDENKYELDNGKYRYRGEKVSIARGKALTSTSSPTSCFHYDPNVSKTQMNFICEEGKYELHNLSPTMGTWKLILKSTNLTDGMRFKVGTDLISAGADQEKKVQGFKFEDFYRSCFRVISSNLERYLYCEPVILVYRPELSS